MKRLLIGLAVVMTLGLPRLSYAQNGDMEYDAEGPPPPYNDVEDGQLLKLVSYFLMPIGWGLEHGLMMPLHTLATDSPAAPVLSGDANEKFFGENSQADLLPADTFRPFAMPADPTQMDTGGGPLVVLNPNETNNSVLPPVPARTVRTVTTTTVTTTTPLAGPSGQTVIH
jgi:hypothetical protein